MLNRIKRALIASLAAGVLAVSVMTPASAAGVSKTATYCSGTHTIYGYCQGTITTSPANMVCGDCDYVTENGKYSPTGSISMHGTWYDCECGTRWYYVVCSSCGRIGGRTSNPMVM